MKGHFSNQKRRFSLAEAQRSSAHAVLGTTETALELPVSLATVSAKGLPSRLPLGSGAEKEAEGYVCSWQARRCPLTALSFFSPPRSFLSLFPPPPPPRPSAAGQAIPALARASSCLRNAARYAQLSRRRRFGASLQPRWRGAKSTVIDHPVAPVHLSRRFVTAETWEQPSIK